MASPANIPAVMSEIAAEAEAHLIAHQQTIWKRTDRLFGFLLLAEWAAAMGIAIWRSPLTWDGPVSHVHPHVWAAIFLGATIVLLPVFLAIRHPAKTVTRHAISIAQMLISGLLIHLGDGRIEMHFHIFGSLAFLAFYRDWKVLISASAVVALDHLLRGIFMPISVYGVTSATHWRTLEHAGWVIFEDIFLIGSCLQGVHEMRGIAESRALLEHSHRSIEVTVQERTEQLKAAQEQLLSAARSAGMAEIATSVLHNVGNVLNSVNVSATIVADKLRNSELPSLSKVGEMIVDNKPQLDTFLTTDERGKLVPDFIIDLAKCLGEEQEVMLAEVTNLSTGIEHIKQIVAAQQSMAKKVDVHTPVDLAKLMETAINMQGVREWEGITIRRSIPEGQSLMLDQHKVLQILINLITNARHAISTRPPGEREITLSVEMLDTPGGRRARFAVTDNGIGISPEAITKIFAHGFTTKKEGHGFGLHGAANSAREMGGTLTVLSDGRGRGSTFTLDVPAASVQEMEPCSR